MQAADAHPTPLSDAPASPPNRDARRNRLVALPMFIAAVVLLGVAHALTPSPTGVGTHEQLGLQPCGFLAAFYIPCATCGMTTAFSHAAHGHLWASFVTQPAGAMLSVATAMLAIISGYAVWSGMSLAPLGMALTRPRVVIPAIAIFLASWAYTVAHHLLYPPGG